MPRVELFCDTHGSRFEGSKCRSLYCCGLVPHFLSSWVCLPGQNILKPHCSGIFMNILGFRPRDGQSSLSPWLILESPWKRASGCVSGGISRNEWGEMTYPECGQHHPLGSGFWLDRREEGNWTPAFVSPHPNCVWNVVCCLTLLLPLYPLCAVPQSHPKQTHSSLSGLYQWLCHGNSHLQ